MLAPIITKDMKLFPTRPLPAGIKNVRSRAQSLDQFTQQQSSVSMKGRIVPVKPRTSQSVGNLPIIAQKSPPKASATRKSTLSAIAEGVEMGAKEGARHERECRKDKENVADRSTRTASNSSKEPTKDTKDSPTKEVKEPKEKKGVVRWLSNALRSKHKPEAKEETDNISTISS